ncbi:MAG: hypothetical protein ACTTKN_06275, partial [Phocaeicola sp.]
MEIITVESQAYQELIDRLNRIEQFVERTSHLIQDIDDELEMTTKDLIGGCVKIGTSSCFMHKAPT